MFVPCPGNSEDIVDLGLIDCHLFLQQKTKTKQTICDQQGIAVEGSGSATMVSHVQVPVQQGKENSLIEGKTKFGGP